MADVITDAVQGITLIIGLLILLFIVLDNAGGTNEAIAQIEPECLPLFQSGGHSWLDTVEQWAIPICDPVLSQELIDRVLATRTPNVARQACFGGGLLYLGIGLAPVTIGLIGAQSLPPGLENPEQMLL